MRSNAFDARMTTARASIFGRYQNSTQPQRTASARPTKGPGDSSGKKIAAGAEAARCRAARQGPGWVQARQNCAARRGAHCRRNAWRPALSACRRPQCRRPSAQAPGVRLPCLERVVQLVQLNTPLVVKANWLRTSRRNWRTWCWPSVTQTSGASLRLSRSSMVPSSSTRGGILRGERSRIKEPQWLGDGVAVQR
jgi:hypothetical protein